MSFSFIFLNPLFFSLIGKLDIHFFKSSDARTNCNQRRSWKIYFGVDEYIKNERIIQTYQKNKI